MDSSMRNPGLLAVLLGVGLAIIFSALGLTTVLPMQLGLGLGVVCLVAAALVYVFFSRANAVTRTGYGAVLMLLAIALIIPLLTVTQQQQQVSASAELYDQNLQTTAALYAQYCASCHGFQGQGINGPKLNNNPDVNKLTNDDITRIISGGIADPANPKTLLMPAWLQEYGGALTEEDIAGLVAFIRSSDSKYLATNSLPNTNGFSYILGQLTNPTQIAEYKNELKSGSRPPVSQFTDLTAMTKVALPIDDTPTAANALWNFTPRYIIIKVGTTVTWTNESTAPHTVTPSNAGAFPASAVLSAKSSGGGTYSYTFTKAGDFPYFCSIHPAMTAWITVQ
jgi:plastocyanin/mono/diheme cytochrome c family protein